MKKKIPQGLDLVNYTPKSQFSRATHSIRRILFGIHLHVMYMYVLI